MVVVGIWASRLPAQEVFVVPAVPYEPALHPPYPAPFIGKLPPQPAKHLYKRALNHFDLGCQPNDWGGTGNFHSEMRWIFGSSRSFFGEPCVPNQPCADRRGQR